ncbi:MAG TPA: hypothetical protein VMX35_08460 [Acidobacteriota bacterium]|nr:hypothetical protein [Acidobacteriota bacterium]
MQISFETCPDKQDYQSLLVINTDARWRESLYFSFYTPFGEKQEKLFAGRAMSDLHFKNKPCVCVLAFDFHRWDEEMIEQALALELPPVAFETPLAELLQKSLEERVRNPEGFAIKIKV